LIELPWPPKELSPNARVHRMQKAAKAKKYRELCRIIALASKLTPPADGKIHLDILFYPPDRRKRDLDNLLASIKSGIDGIADAWKINDTRFRPYTIDFADETGPKVEIRIKYAQ